MLNIGIIGMGSMGFTHLSAYAKRGDVRVVAVADPLFSKPGAAPGRAGNLQGQSGGESLEGIKKYARHEDLIADPEVQALDICVP